MAGLNHVFISGNCTRDPEIRYLKSGMVLCSFSIVANRSFQKDGEWQRETSFVDIKCWGELGERISRELRKGIPVIVQGELRQEKWTANDGSARSQLVVIADRVTPVQG